MMRRYGQGPVQIRPLIASALGRWMDIYDRQAEEEAFDTPEAILEALNLTELFEQSSYDFFHQQGIDQRYLEEFASGLARFDFGQDANIHALADAMSLIGTGIRGQNYVIKGGNELLCQTLLEAAGAEIRLETAVERIARQSADDGTADRYKLTTSTGDSEIFDAIIIATPLESAELHFDQTELPAAATIKRPYQTIYATFVAGTLRSAYFGVAKKDLPNFIMTKENDDIPFLSISDVGQAKEPAAKIYKIFSRSKPTDSLLDDLFNDYDEETIKQISWQACPILKPGAELPPFALAEGLYYINAIESLAPTMEAITIASRNAINLLDEELLEPVDDEE
jgi:prenylcysteine oxidase/farnesylcysteine lyase